MNRSTCVLALLAVLAVPALPSAVQAAEVSFFRGKAADVEFFSTDPTGCFATSVIIHAHENRSFSPPAPLETNAWADVIVDLYNSCTGEQTTCGSGTIALPDGAFDINGLLASASLNATGEVHDNCAGTDLSIALALHWTGEGEIFRGRSQSSTHSPGSHTWYRQSGQLRDATVTGSLTLDGEPLSLGTGFGTLSRATHGTITRSH